MLHWRSSLLLVLLHADAIAARGYHVDFQSFGELIGVKNRLQGIEGLEEGFTVGSWLKYRDLSKGRLQMEVNIVHQRDDNFLNGFGGAGRKPWLFSGGLPDTFSEHMAPEEFLQWHHYAFTFESATGSAKMYIDGAKVTEFTKEYNYATTWADLNPSITLGTMCYLAPDGVPRFCFLQSRMFNGLMDDFSFFVGAQSEAEIAQKWNASMAERIAAGLEPKLALFYDFNDPLSTPGEIPNLGTAGPGYNALAGKTDGAMATAVALNDVGIEVPTLTPAFVAADAIPNKQEEPAAPLVVYALPGTAVDLAAHGLPAGETYDAPADLNATVVLERAGTMVHVLPLCAPEVLDERHRLISAVEDSPVAIYLLPGPQHTWSRGMRPVVTRLPARGKLYVQQRLEDRLLTVPVTEGEPIDDGVDHAYSVLYVPDAQGYGEPYDSFATLTRLNSPIDGPFFVPIETAAVDWTIDVRGVDDLPSVTSVAYAFEEDGVPGGFGVLLNLSDFERSQVLAGHVTTLPKKGTLYSLDGAGARTAITEEYNSFDVGTPVLRQYLSRVLRVSSFWGSNPPHAGYHPLAILGPPDCEFNLLASECTMDQPWVGDAGLYPELGTHVMVNGHVHRVRAIDAAAATLQLEMQGYYKKNASGVLEQCHMDPYDASLYPEGCLLASEGGAPRGVVAVPRADITAFNEAVWSPLNKNSARDALMEGGGFFGPEYAYSHNAADTYVGPFPYTEYIEVAVETPVYIFGLVLGLPRGAGSIVGIRAKNGDEWVRMYEGEPLTSVYREQLENGGPYWRWSPPICRTHFKTDTIRIEMDTAAIEDWNYIDYVEVLGSEITQDSALKHSSWLFEAPDAVSGTQSEVVTQSVHVLYVPHENANGRDSFEYQANDCPGDIFRSSESGVVSFEIAPVNDAPTLRKREVDITARAAHVLDFGGSSQDAAQHLLNDVETPVALLEVVLTRLPSVGTFHDGDAPIDRAQLPHDSMANAPPEERPSISEAMSLFWPCRYRLADAGKALRVELDSLDGLGGLRTVEQAAEDGGSALLRQVAIAEVGFTATDPEGAALAATLTLNVFAPLEEMTCKAQDHYLEQRGSVVSCKRCPTRLAASDGSSTCDICAEGHFRLTADAGAAASCRPCPPFAVRCGRDATLGSMELAAGWWRAGNGSAQWHWCGSEAGLVKFELLSWMEGNSPPPGNRSDPKAERMCHGGAFPPTGVVDDSCAEHHVGPLCRACNTSYHLDAASLTCEECPENDALAYLALAVLLVVLVLVVAYRYLRAYRNKPCRKHAESGRLRRAVARCHGLIRRPPLARGYSSYPEERLSCLAASCRYPTAESSLLHRALHPLLLATAAALVRVERLRKSQAWVPTIKLVIAYSQVVSSIPSVYDVVMPDLFYDWLAWLNFFSFRWAFELGIPSACVGGSLAERIAVYGLAPLVLMLALPLLAALYESTMTAHARLTASAREGSGRPRRGASHGLRELTLRTMPAMLFIAFISLVAISHRMFSVYDCMSFEADSLSSPTRSSDFVATDLSVACNDLAVTHGGEMGSEYARVKLIAAALIAVWPVGMPLAFVIVLFSMRHSFRTCRATRLTRATSFLHHEFEPQFFFWEPIVLVQRLAITGWIQLIPNHLQVIRIFVGTLVTLTYATILMFLKPYLSLKVDMVSIASQFSLVIVFLCALLLKVYDLTDSAGIAADVTGFASKDVMGVFLVLVTFLILAVFLAVAAVELLNDSRTQKLRLIKTQKPPVLQLGGGQRFHLFLSHTWSTAQDQVAVIKHMLQAQLPGARIFLDVDDLEDIGALEAYVEGSQAILIFLSRGYLTSKNCLRELDYAIAQRKPLVVVHEADPSKGGLSLEVLRLEFERHEQQKRGFRLGERHSHEKRGPGTVVGVDKEAGTVTITFDDKGDTHAYRQSSQHKLRLLDASGDSGDSGGSAPTYLFDHHPIIRWMRIAEFQAVSLRKIAEGIVAAMPEYVRSQADLSLYIPGTLHRQNMALPPGVMVYTSRFCPGAAAFAAEVKDYLESDRLSAVDDASTQAKPSEAGVSRRQSQSRRVMDFSTEDAEALATPGSALTHMLLYLNQHTFQGDDGDELFDEVRAAHTRGLKILLIHECDEERHSCAFETFFEQTPQLLITEGLYDQLAITCHAPPFRQVSLALAVKALGGQPVLARASAVKVLLAQSYV